MNSIERLNKIIGSFVYGEGKVLNKIIGSFVHREKNSSLSLSSYACSGWVLIP